MTVPFLQDIMSGYQEKNYQLPPHTHTQFEETEQSAVPTSDVAGMLDLSDQELKPQGFLLLRVLMDKKDSIEEEMGSLGLTYIRYVK